MNRFKILRKIAIFFLLFATGMHIIIYSIYLGMGALGFNDLEYSELSWTQLVNNYPNLAYLISGYIRMMGIVVIVLEVFVLHAIYLIFWKSSKPALIIATIGSVVPLIMELIQTFPVLGFDIPYFMYIMLTVMVAIALLIAGKEIFGNNINKN